MNKVKVFEKREELKFVHVRKIIPILRDYLL